MSKPPFSVDMTIQGIERLIRQLRDPKTAGKPVTWGMRNSGLAVEREAKRLVPVNTGRLRDDITTEVESRFPFPRRAQVGPGVVYGKFVEWGTGLFGPLSRRIVPRTKKALAWTGKGGTTMVRRSVAGMKPRPYMAPGLERAQGRINDIWKEVGRRLTKEIARGR